MSPVLDIFERGGWAMWPLLALSVVSLAVTLERGLFWLACRRGAARQEEIAAALRTGSWDRAARLASGGGGVGGGPLGRFITASIARRPMPDQESEGDARDRFESVLLEGAEAARSEAERFHAIHQSIITAAPMIGILGTVTGIISSFSLLGGDPSAGGGGGGGGSIADPALVAPGIAEALITTAAGLIVALGTLFPHALFRSWADGFVTRLEVLAAAALGGLSGPTSNAADD